MHDAGKRAFTRQAISGGTYRVVMVKDWKALSDLVDDDFDTANALMLE